MSDGNNKNFPTYASVVGGFGQKDQDQSQTGLLITRKIGPHWFGVAAADLYKNPIAMPARRFDQQMYSGPPDPGTTCLFQQAHTGSLNGCVTGLIGEFPKMEQVPPGGKNLQMPGITIPQALPGNDVTQPLEGTHTKSEPTQRNRGGVPVKGEPKQPQPYIPYNEVNNKPYYGRPYSERGRPWQAETNVATSETPFSQMLNNSMLSQLPGQVMSLANAFRGLSRQQSQKIRESVSDEMYNIINATLSTAVDYGDDDVETSLQNRVDPETYKKNLVDLLCQCTTYSDIVSVMGRMRDDKSLYGQDKLPAVEFPVPSGFGDVGLIIHGTGEVSQNVSNTVALAQQDFGNFLTEGTLDTTLTAKFFGEIKENVLTVNQMSFGKIELGPDYELSGIGVTDDTIIVSRTTGRGLEGQYIVNFVSNTLPNTEMTLVKNAVREPPVSAGGGGGGLVGTIPGQNFFGEASKLVNEILPVLEPSSSQKIQQLIQKIAKDTKQINGVKENWLGPVTNSFRKFIGG